MRNFISLLLLILMRITLAAQSVAPFENSQFAVVGGLQIHFRQWNPDKLVTGHVLLVHGFCGSTFSWRKNIDTLIAQGYHVMAVDLPPFGYSDRKRGVNHAPSVQAVLLWGLIDQLGFPTHQSWHLIGHSMGAAIIGAMAAMRPHQTAKLVCVDGTILRVRAEAGPWIRRLLAAEASQTLVNALGRLHYFRPRPLGRMLRSAYGTVPSPADLEGYRTPLLLRHTASGIFDLYAQAKPAFHYSESDVRAPVLVVWGAEDAWIPLKAGKAFVQVLPEAHLEVFPQAGHCPMETHAPRFNALISKWLAS